LSRSLQRRLTPFAVALSQQLRDTYLRLVRDVIEKGESKNDDEYGEYLDDKSITALGVLQTIGTLILTLESTPEVLLHMETILMPRHRHHSCQQDCTTSSTRSSRSSTAARSQPKRYRQPCGWAFERIYQTYKGGAELYLEDMLPALENFVNYGAQSLIVNKQHLDAVVDIVRTIFQDDKGGGAGAKLADASWAEAVMLSLRGHIDEYIPVFIQLAMHHLVSDEPKVKSYRTYLMEVVINAIYYNPRLAMHVLESNGWTNKFLSLWFSNIDNFTRVHDKKLAIVAIVELLSLQAHEIPVSVQQGWPRLLTGIVRPFSRPCQLPSRVSGPSTWSQMLTCVDREEVTKEDNYEVFRRR